MSTIRAIYHPNPDGSRQSPKFPAADQHPSASRYDIDHPTFGALCVDACDGAPTLAEIDAILQPSQDVRAGLAIDGVDRLQFDVMFTQENNIRALRALINTLIPNSFTAAQSAQITRAQFRDALINRWKALNP